MSNAPPPEFRKIARDLAKGCIVTQALARFIEQIIEELHESQIKPLIAERNDLQRKLEVSVHTMQRHERTVCARDRRIARLVQALEYARLQGVVFPGDADPRIVSSEPKE
ncbi:hypothetical protein CHELA41_24515 [Hyphomicrobiales bacterium]|nr:hypothetical protein CHELA41_24515 [Hyphomicrobiales bacterium]